MERRRLAARWLTNWFADMATSRRCAIGCRFYKGFRLPHGLQKSLPENRFASLCQNKNTFCHRIGKTCRLTLIRLACRQPEKAKQS
ncbi:hypothetical protein GCWU000324_02951 [Kingella oralis ATCC 51147]|uniref:Uncharacterized protein n=1 Tax=Kingella oralis ATCC 51147 TaxID=629741 RepID=C4GML7_9NEIS|nr:hypothetical protein GCWU000324_02951 [Kingella oralis ATCC 51147]